MKPTPVQIEAAKKAYWEMLHNKGSQIAALEAALTAAAKVDTMANPVARLDAGGANFAPQAVMSAAAEVGEDAPCNDVEWEKAKRDLNNRTIERCAQVADGYPAILMASAGSSLDSACRGIAAAIRALEDKP